MIPMKPPFGSFQGTSVPQKRAILQPDCDLLTRTSWTDAAVALSQINKGKASGNKAALWLRTWLQGHLFLLGCFIQRNAGKVLFVGLLVLSTFCVGLKSATMQTNVEKLWVEEGGRLEKELRYIRTTLGEGSGSTNQILIQTPRVTRANLLHPDALLVHLRAVRAATQVSVEMFNLPWSLKDLCYSPSPPNFDIHHIDKIIERLFPCAIITPLDCFWEGAKLLGPDLPVKIPGLKEDLLQWTDLNPLLLLETMKFGSDSSSFPLHMIETFMKRAGITTAYQEKPCLDPSDSQCPKTAPNKHSRQAPDIGAELTGGCHGFATKYMHWPEDVIVGGVIKNKTGHIIRAEALQTIVQLMAEKQMYEYWQDQFKVLNLDWTMDKARMILEAWQRKFSEVVLKESQNINITKQHKISVFSTASLDDIMKDFSEISVTRVAIGYLAMLAYAWFSLMRWSDPIQSQSGIGIAGVILVAIAVAAGLGFCAIFGIAFNASTTQIVPFLALGLGMDDMFLLAHTYAENANSDVPTEDQTGDCLKKTGVNVLLTSFSNMCAFFAAAIIPIPALRAFVLQAAVLVIFNVAAILFVFPAVVSLDLRRRDAKRVDVFCCFSRENQITPLKVKKSESLKSISKSKFGSSSSLSQAGVCSGVPKRQAVTHALPPDGSHVITVLAPPVSAQPTECWTENNNSAPSVENLSCTNSSSTKELIVKKGKSFKQKCVQACAQTKQECYSWSLSWFATHHYAPLLQTTPAKVLTVVTFLITFTISVWGMLQVEDGLELTDIVPRNTNEYEFLSAQAKYFGFFNMFAITQGNFEYPTNQRLLYDYYEAFTRIDKIIKNDDGGLPEFWLSLFRNWLIGLQHSFDQDWKNGCITQERWFVNASDDGILTYKLLVQTGRIDNPIDKSLVTTMRMVNGDGIINPKAFYNYLTAWVSNDALAYSASQANLRPEPRTWIHDRNDVELKIPKSQPLVYSQLPFYLNKMSTTQEITETIEAIRTICQKYEEKGLPNFPTGIPFIYWEQYLGLRFYLLLALLCILAVIFVVVSLLLVNPWAAFIVVAILAITVVELFGFMGFLGIRLSAVPSVILIVAVGIGVEFTAHVIMGFLTSIGSRNRRMGITLQHMFAPVIHGAVSTLVGVVMLAFSEFDFIIRYFFYVLFALVVIGLINGLVLLPVVLSLIGPLGEVIPHDNPNRIATPSPEPSPIRQRLRHSRPFSKRIYPRVNSEISLSTITEEPASCHSSHEIVVQPEVVVETTTITNTTAGGGTTVSTSTTTPQDNDCQSHDGSNQSNTSSSRNSTTTSTSTLNSNSINSPSSTTQTAVTTRVTATAKVKVEVHTPLPGAVEREHSSRHRRRRESSSSKSSAGEFDEESGS